MFRCDTKRDGLKRRRHANVRGAGFRAPPYRRRGRDGRHVVGLPCILVFWRIYDSSRWLADCESISEVDTVASWNIGTDAFSAGHADAGHLVIGSRRYLGGLHSERYGARIDIWFNGQQLDGFGLFVKPEHHRDYFHRVPPGSLVAMAPFTNCETVYSWPLRVEQIRTGLPQVVKVRLITMCDGTSTMWVLGSVQTGES